MVNKMAAAAKIVVAGARSNFPFFIVSKQIKCIFSVAKCGLEFKEQKTSFLVECLCFGV